MSHLTQLPIESYLLAEHAVPIECLVCDQENCYSAARCRNCSSPMSLAHQTQSVKKKPHLIAVIGPSGAGKTTYLGLLMDMLTRHVSLLRSTARGPMSISLQQATTTALATGWFPEKTPNDPEHWHWVHCQFNCRRRRRPLELAIADISGESLATETERTGRYPAIRSLLTKCAAVLVLADAERLQAGDHAQDFVTLKLLSLLGELRNESSSRPVRRRAGQPARVCRGPRGRAVERLPIALPPARCFCLLRSGSHGVPRQLRPPPAGAAARRAARHRRAVRLVDVGAR
jgi:Double-GTPase 2